MTKTTTEPAIEGQSSAMEFDVSDLFSDGDSSGKGDSQAEAVSEQTVGETTDGTAAATTSDVATTNDVDDELSGEEVAGEEVSTEEATSELESEEAKENEGDDEEEDEDLDDGPQPGDPAPTQSTSGEPAFANSDDFAVRCWNAEQNVRKAEARWLYCKEQTKNAKSELDTAVVRLREIVSAIDNDRNRPLFSKSEEKPEEPVDDKGASKESTTASETVSEKTTTEGPPVRSIPTRVRFVKDIIDPPDEVVTFQAGDECDCKVDKDGDVIIVVDNVELALEPEEFEVIAWKPMPEPEDDESENSSTTESTTKAGPPNDDETWRAVHISKLGLPNALVAKVEAKNLITLGDLELFRSKNELTDIPGVGKAKAEKIEKALEDFYGKLNS